MSAAKKSLIFLCCLILFTLTACSGSQVREEESPERKMSQTNVKLGLEYLRKGDRKQALLRLKRAVELDSDNPNAYHGLALVYQQFGQADKADDYFQEAIDLDDEDSALQNNYGAFLCQQKKYEKAEEHFMQALKDPTYGTPDRAWENAGLCAYRGGDNERAEKHLRTALKINAKLPASLLAMAHINFAKKDYLRTRAYLQRYEQSGQATPDSLWLGIQSEKKLGDRKAVARYVMTLRSRFPDSDQARRLANTKY